MSIVIGKNDGISYQFMPKVGETDVFIESAEGQGRQIIRFLDVESLKIFQEALERMQLGMAVAKRKAS